MTPARKAALQWFHDRGEVSALSLISTYDPTKPSFKMRRLLVREEQAAWRVDEDGEPLMSLTEKGRRDLHEAKP